MSEMKKPIRAEWNDYYDILEEIREEGSVNMWGADVTLKERCPELSRAEAIEILLSWITNYSELAEEHGWGRKKKLKNISKRVDK